MMLRALITLVLLSCTVGVVSPLPAAAQSAEDTRRWERYLARGAEAYDRGDLEDALTQYNAALQIRDAPMLRLQIAVIHEKLGDCSTAKVLYAKLIDDEDDKAASAAEERLEGIADCAAAPGKSIDLAPAREEAEGRSRRKTLYWVMFGGGMAMMTGGTLTLLTLFVSPNARDCGTKNGTPDCTRYAEDHPDDTSAEIRERAQSVLRTHRIIGASVVGAGAVLSVTAIALMAADRTRAPVVLYFGPGSVELTVRF